MVQRRAFLAELKAEGCAWETASRVEVKMLATAVEECLEHHIRVNIWNEFKVKIRTAAEKQKDATILELFNFKFAK